MFLWTICIRPKAIIYRVRTSSIRFHFKMMNSNKKKMAIDIATFGAHIHLAVTADDLTLEEKLDSLPKDPGVYQFKNGAGRVIYVGKAKVLRNRVRSYFLNYRRGVGDGKFRALVSKIADVEVILTDSDVEALILENTLIKKLKPRYNVNLKDDKSYPYVVVTNEPYPRVFSTRHKKRDGSKYYGALYRSGLSAIFA